MIRYLWIGLVGWAAVATAGAAVGQSLIELLRSERLRVQAEEMLRREGLHARPLPPQTLRIPADTLWDRLDGGASPPAAAADEPPPFPLKGWKLVRKLERFWFEKTFGETAWAFLGSNTFDPLDTLWTRDLRARLEAHFGPPTVTLAELENLDDRAADEYLEFAYWFVLNDTIPLIVTDVNGPLERGLVVASDRRFRDDLRAIRQALLQPLVDEPRRAPYVDYYYHHETGTWYRTGYADGAFFMDRIRRPPLYRGRPRLRGPTG